MPPTPETLIAELELAPHPEGGFYREFFRSARAVTPQDGRGERAALTAIHFLLPAGHHSRWHEVRSDEGWTFLAGDPLELYILDPVSLNLRECLLGATADGYPAAVVVPAGAWQAARPTGSFSLVTCAVGPGFDFSDFRLLADDPAAAERIRSAQPRLAELL